MSQLLPMAAEGQSAMGVAIATNLPWVLMLVVGFALVLVEMYVPGFGLPGIAGIILLVAGIALCSRGDLVLALVLVIIIVALLCVALSISIRSAAKGRLSRSKLVLNEVSLSKPVVDEHDLDFYVGRKGVASTVLRPAGIAEFDGVRLNVLTEGDFVPEGARVTVERVEGNRIVVTKD